MMSRQQRLRRGLITPAIIGSVGLLSIGCIGMRSAEAEFGPCASVTPTTRDVIVYVSDMKRSVSWYLDNVGLSEVYLFKSIERDSRAVVMEKDGNGVTLVSSGKEKQPLMDPQRVCFPQKGAHDPTRSSSTIFLVDPDGTQVELPTVP